MLQRGCAAIRSGMHGTQNTFLLDIPGFEWVPIRASSGAFARKALRRRVLAARFAEGAASRQPHPQHVPFKAPKSSRYGVLKETCCPPGLIAHPL